MHICFLANWRKNACAWLRQKKQIKQGPSQDGVISGEFKQEEGKEKLFRFRIYMQSQGRSARRETTTLARYNSTAVI
jgi:hypothetical protein